MVNLALNSMHLVPQERLQGFVAAEVPEACVCLLLGNPPLGF